MFYSKKLISELKKKKKMKNIFLEKLDLAQVEEKKIIYKIETTFEVIKFLFFYL